MPSARELLDQADALMRRNRAVIVDDIPVLTDSVEPVPPMRASRPRSPPPAKPNTIQTAPPDSIPTLTERLPPKSASAPAAVVEEGEPSDWLQLGNDEPSAIGEAPDSIAIVPDVTQEAVFHARMDERITQEIVNLPPEVEADFDAEAEGRPPPEQVPPAAPTSATSLAAAFAPSMLPPDLPATESFEGEPNDVVESEVQTDSMADIVDEAAPSPIALDVDAEVDAQPVERADVAPSPAAPESLDDAILGVPLDSVAASAASAASESAQWSAVAEEIRMQVLQRIDLFTDTGLREQLGARLKPIVDRASADLVSTINQHVGDLLRTYVAEAIEREIENWRRDH